MKRVALIAVSAILISTLFYWYLGGFEPIPFEHENSVSLDILGRDYVGPQRSQQLNLLMSQIGDLVIGDNSLVIVEYQNELEDSISLFIGLTSDLDEDSITIEGLILRKREFRISKALTANISMPASVRPSPNKVKEMAQDFLVNSGKLSSYSIEIYSENEDLKVIFPIEE